MMSKTAPLKDGSVTEQMNVPRMRRRKARTGMTVVYATEGSTGSGAGTGAVIAEYIASGTATMSTPKYSWWRKTLALATAVVASADVTLTDPWTWVAPDQRRVRVSVTAELSLPWGVGLASVAVKVDGIDAAVAFLGVNGRYEIDHVIHVRAGESVTLEVRARNEEAVEKTVTVTACSVRLEES